MGTPPLRTPPPVNPLIPPCVVARYRGIWSDREIFFQKFSRQKVVTPIFKKKFSRKISPKIWYYGLLSLYLHYRTNTILYMNKNNIESKISFAMQHGGEYGVTSIRDLFNLGYISESRYRDLLKGLEYLHSNSIPCNEIPLGEFKDCVIKHPTAKVNLRYLLIG